jgi:Hydrogenase-1 expression protein HyaE
MNSIAIADMLERGVLQTVDSANVDSFLAGPGLRVVFFAGPGNQHGDSHDVAVALREVLKEYKDGLSAALVAAAHEAKLQSRFRVLTLPSLALCVGGDTLEVIPGVRDWSDYSRAFRRYLGNTGTQTYTESHQQ